MAQLASFWLDLLPLPLIWVSPYANMLTGETFGTEDPRTGEIYTQVAEAQEADVDEAVKAARQVQTGSHTPLAACLCNTLC